MKHYYRNNADPIHIRLKEDEDYKFVLDVSQWVDDNSAITSATWVVESGEATVDNKTTSSPNITAYFSNTSGGTARVVLSWTDGTGTGIQNIFLRFVEQVSPYTSDYGLQN